VRQTGTLLIVSGVVCVLVSIGFTFQSGGSKRDCSGAPERKARRGDVLF